MAQKIRKNTNPRIQYSEPVIFKGRIVEIGKYYKPYKDSSSKVELKIEVRYRNTRRIINAEAWSKLAYEVFRRIKKNNTVIAIGQPAIFRGEYSRRDYLMLDVCSEEGAYKSWFKFRRKHNLKFKIEAERKLTEGLSYEEFEEKYFSS